ncbi:cation diffusion facilitator family transporter [Methanoculleus sp. UBA208]|uniref:cation diffusion facilitator family transporter n=1 Tax=Methanoculleus sp. UBA208 TaxID=1915494 RepID=UPI002600A44A|nr:cation diffusion facilitator family transporter [Methanoculleus sp. UBA208]
MQEEVQEAAGSYRTPDSVILRVALLSLAVNAGLIVAKLGLSVYSGSLALRADGIHSFVDVVASIALIAGVLLSSRKRRDFPYGLYKVENVVSVAIALLIFFTAFEIAAEAVTGDAVAMPYSGWVLLAVAAFIPVPYILGTYEVNVGQKYNSPSLIADGQQHRADVLSSSIVFFALLGQFFGIPLDRIAAVIVAVFIVRAGWGILKDSMRTLLDASVDYDTLNEIHTIILSDPMVSSIKRITGRNSGRYIFVEAMVEMAESDFEKAHRASERIEQDIRRQVPNVERVLIHYEPKKKTHLRYAVPLQDREGLISAHFGEAPYFAILDYDVEKNSIERQDIVANPFKDVEKRKGGQAAEMLLAQKIDVVLLHHSLAGRAAGYALEAAGVEMRMTPAATLAEVIDDLVGRHGEEGGASLR